MYESRVNDWTFKGLFKWRELTKWDGVNGKLTNIILKNENLSE